MAEHGEVEIRTLVDDPTEFGLVLEDEHLTIRAWLNREQVAVVMATMRRWLERGLEQASNQTATEEDERG